MEKKWEKFKEISLDLLLGFIGWLPHLILFWLFHHYWFNSDVSKDTILYFVIVFFGIMTSRKIKRMFGLQGW